MGAKVSVVNQTPYAWNLSTKDRGFTRVNPGSSEHYEEKKLVHRYIYIRYDHHTWNFMSYEFNTHKGDTSFILRETYDRSQIQMHCTSEGGTKYCPNYDVAFENVCRKEKHVCSRCSGTGNMISMGQSCHVLRRRSTIHLGKT